MANNGSGFQLKGTGPEDYERYMVPIHCMSLAEDLVKCVRLLFVCGQPQLAVDTRASKLVMIVDVTH